MSKRKSYTAQEMREAADFFMRNSESVRQKVMSNSVLANIHESTEMLRQAAEMRERCEEVIADVNGHNSRFDHGIATPEFDANEIVDYILRGDAESEEK